MNGVTRIRLPAFDWRPREDQLPLWSALENGTKRALEIAHRRWGKDDIALHNCAVKLHQRVGTYWHMLPEGEQARKAIWEAVNPKTGKRRIDDAFPEELRDVTRNNEMFIRFRCGSSWQVVGSDNYESLIGSPPVGCTFSEWATAKPQAWDMLRPIFVENDGWALFITTPRGKNHAHRMLQGAKGDPYWFTEVRTALQSPVFSPEQLAREKAELIREHGTAIGTAIFRQEYMCEFDAPVVGAIYPEETQKVRDTGRLTRVPHDPALPVSTFWDIGRSDSTSIWFTQQRFSEIRVIRYLEDKKKGYDHYAAELNKLPYNYAVHVLPHDGNHGNFRALGGKSAVQLLKPLLGGRVTYVPNKLSLEQGINLVRAILPRCVFDEALAGEGFDGLSNYRRDINAHTKEERSVPVHNWASHPSDAMRTLACYIKDPQPITGDDSKSSDDETYGENESWMAA